MSKIFKLKFTAGFTLVETLVAISIFTVSLLGMMSVLGSSIANTNYAKQKMLATYLAQEGIEYVRNMRDTATLYTANGWTNGFKAKLASCTEKDDNNKACGFVKPTLSVAFNVKTCSSSDMNGCKLFINNGGYDTVSTGTDSGFVRKVWMTGADGFSNVSGNDEEVRIFSEVSWTQRSGKYSITFSENLFNWVEL